MDCFVLLHSGRKEDSVLLFSRFFCLQWYSSDKMNGLRTDDHTRRRHKADKFFSTRLVSRNNLIDIFWNKFFEKYLIYYFIFFVCTYLVYDLKILNILFIFFLKSTFCYICIWSLSFFWTKYLISIHTKFPLFKLITDVWQKKKLIKDVMCNFLNHILI